MVTPGKNGQLLKFVIAFQRNPAMTRSQCHDYMRTKHGPLVSSVPEFAKMVRRYVQNYSLDSLDGANGKSFDIDGAAELWFDSVEDFQCAYALPRYIELVRPDESTFTDTGRYAAAFTRERELWSNTEPAEVKLIRFLAPTTGIDEKNARKIWSEGYVDCLEQNTDIRPLIHRYVQSWSIPISENPFPVAEHFSGIDELWFKSTADARRFCEAEKTLLIEKPMLSAMGSERNLSFIAVENEIPGYA